MSKKAILRAAIEAVKETLARTGDILSRQAYKEVVYDTAEDIEKIGQVYESV